MNTSSAEPAPRTSWYRIRVEGRLAPRWATCFDGMTLTTEDGGTTVIQGAVVDQAALHGLLQRVRDAGLPLVSVLRVGPDHPTGPVPPPR